MVVVARIDDRREGIGRSGRFSSSVNCWAASLVGGTAFRLASIPKLPRRNIGSTAGWCMIVDIYA